jgi:hypothetical protein
MILNLEMISMSFSFKMLKLGSNVIIFRKLTLLALSSAMNSAGLDRHLYTK